MDILNTNMMDIPSLEIESIFKVINAIREQKSKQCFLDSFYKILAIYTLKERIKKFNKQHLISIEKKISGNDFSSFEKGEGSFAYKVFPFELAVEYENLLYHSRSFLDYTARAISFSFNPKTTPPGNIKGLLSTLKQNYSEDNKAKQIIKLFAKGWEYKQLNGLLYASYPPDLKNKQSHRDNSAHYEKPDLYFYIDKNKNSYSIRADQALLNLYQKKHTILQSSSNAKIIYIVEHIHNNCNGLFKTILNILFPSNYENSLRQ